MTDAHRERAGQLLRRARRRRAWSQAEFARRAGMPASQLCAYETGTKQPSAAMLVRLLELAGLDLTATQGDVDRLRQGQDLLDVLQLVDAMPPPEKARPMIPPFHDLVRR